MESSSDKSSVSALAIKYRTRCLVVQFFNAMSACYYFNYVFFYLKAHFGFGDGGNLLFSSMYGLIYMITAAGAGAFAYKHGYFKTLRLGFSGTLTMMLLGGTLPHILGYTNVLLTLEWVILVLWTISSCSTWPTIQALISSRQTPVELPRVVGYYNMCWAGANSVAYLTSGPLLDGFNYLSPRFGSEILFWVSGSLNIIQLTMLPGMKKMEAQIATFDAPPDTSGIPLPSLNPRPIAKARNFLHLAWVANPFAYVAIYGLLPIIPKLAQDLGLTATWASLICSVWFWTRLVAFAWFAYWPGWHYKFRWLLAAFVALVGSFIAVLLGGHIWSLILAQVVFGLAVSLLYYSSLFYSMDVGESKGKRGGFHEAAIGLGIFMGPGAGFVALQIFPQHTNAGIWGMCSLLIAGLALFLGVRYRSLRQP